MLDRPHLTAGGPQPPALGPALDFTLWFDRYAGSRLPGAHREGLDARHDRRPPRVLPRRARPSGRWCRPPSRARACGSGRWTCPTSAACTRSPTPKLGGSGAILVGGPDRRLDLPALGPARPAAILVGRDRDHRGRRHRRPARPPGRTSSCSARPPRRSSRSPPGSRVDSFTLPFLGRVDPGSVQLIDPPGSARSIPARC